MADRCINGKTNLISETRVLARWVVVVGEREIQIVPICLPHRLMFFECEGRSCVQVTFEANEICHRSECVIQYDVHSSRMNFVNGIPPILDGTEMVIENCKVNRRV